MQTKKEKWKQLIIPGVDAEILVSSLGRIKSVSYIGGLGWHGGKARKKANREVTPSDNGKGYKYITVTCNGKRKHIYIHRAVAELFIDNPECKPYVNHIDFNRGNNSVENLEWCTPHENNMHSRNRMCHPKPSAKVGKYGRGIKLKKNAYEVNIYHRKKQYYCGRFNTVEEAIAARDKKYSDLGISANG